MTIYDDIYEIAADNYGLVTSAEAKGAGASDKELSRIAKDGRLTRIGYGVYRIKHWVPTELDPYAEAVALVGQGAYLYAESVIAMHALAPTNPALIHVATPNRVRRSLPASIEVVRRPDCCDTTEYEGIPSQTVPAAIRSCRGTMMTSRLVDAARRARELGLIRAEEEMALLEDLNGGD
ncbi:type IV toxin-antitoxin system AbiEi family antitoxin domain-containing protein [Slackia heliotrinireducens]|uniref:type IV toxin-antitoxin system AbiEi family antitoxin domain-containing protein n=1 Tax=Slackia heliotrinireducens TaxID=84110 RepID=UPI00331603A3